MRFLLLISISVLCLVLPVAAQAPAPDHSLNPLPATASWTVTFRYPSDAPKESAVPPREIRVNPHVFTDRPREVRGTRTGALMREEITWVSGARTETWTRGSHRLEQVPGRTDFVLRDYSDVESGNRGPAPRGFEDLDWISPGTFRGEISIDGRKVWLFETPASSGELRSPIGRWSSGRAALVSPETHLPLFFADGSVEYLYTYDSAPAVELKLPQKLRGQLK